MVTLLAAMVRKDLMLFFSDRRAMTMSFVVPIAIASFFGSIFSGGGGAPQAARVPVIVVDEDRSAVSTRLVARASQDPTFALTVADAAAARDAVRAGRVTVAVVVPAGFGDAASRAFLSGANRPSLTMWYDPSRGMELAVVRGVMTQYVMETVSAEVFSGPSGARIVDEQLQALDSTSIAPEMKESLGTLLGAARDFYRKSPAGAGGGGLTLPYTVSEQAVTSGDRPYNGYAHAFAGMGIQFLFFAMIDLGVGILLERERGLWKRLRSAPVSRLSLLAGKAISGSLIALASLLVSFAFAMVVFGVRIHGSLLGFAFVAVACAAMACTFGLLVAALGRTPGSTRGLASLAVLLMVMLGGAWVPTFVFPAWMQRLTVVVPARWAVDGLDAMTWRGLGLEAAWLPVAVLLGFGALFGTLAAARFRWEE